VDFQEVVRRRRMVRSYDTNRPVPADLVDRIVRNGLRAPSPGWERVSSASRSSGSMPTGRPSASRRNSPRSGRSLSATSTTRHATWAAGASQRPRRSTEAGGTARPGETTQPEFQPLLPITESRALIAADSAVGGRLREARLSRGRERNGVRCGRRGVRGCTPPRPARLVGDRQDQVSELRLHALAL